MAAAVALFSVNEITEEAREVLLKLISTNGTEERFQWIGLQCLVEYQYHDNCIVKLLLTNLVLHDVNTPKYRMYV